VVVPVYWTLHAIFRELGGELFGVQVYYPHIAENTTDFDNSEVL
jgi:hypothetical protein